MRRFNAYTLMYKTRHLFVGRDRCSSAMKLQWNRMMSERLGTWREPMSRKRPGRRRMVRRLAIC